MHKTRSRGRDKLHVHQVQAETWCVAFIETDRKKGDFEDLQCSHVFLRGEVTRYPMCSNRVFASTKRTLNYIYACQLENISAVHTA